MKRQLSRKSRAVSRRDLFCVGGVTAAAGALSSFPAVAAPGRTEPPPDVYTRLGVRPFINCTATLTINGGSRMLPEVIEAIEQASHYHVDLDELMEGAGKRLAELLKVEWAIVTSGAAAALSHATVACIAGTDPEKMKQVPDLTGLKNEVVVPKSSQNEYFHAVRATGVRMIEVDSEEELRSALGPQTAMVIVLGTRWDKPRLSLAEVAPIAKAAGVPVLVDGAADYLIVPNPYIAEGADLVAYSGGKITRGPQSAGLLIGREDLVRAAFANSAPHHAFGRMMKVGKEEIVGMVTAVEVWFSQRNIESEYKLWEGWYDHISAKIQSVDGVSTRVRGPGRGSPFPSLSVEWDLSRIGLTAGEIGQKLLGGNPRIKAHASGDGNSLLIRPAAMKPEEYKQVADRLLEIFRNAPKPRDHSPAPPAGDVSGRWDVEVKFVRGEASHLLFLEARGNEIHGTHIGTRQRTDLKGSIDGDKVRLRGMMPFQGTRVAYDFEGTLSGDRMSGKLGLDEYPSATWTAVRRSA
ncbi:MAG: aminotransferase class V-fold PLP-dependent enzyme [Bryobacteraceae bacterium]|nr:aminotransferase class V-fold PLP-dependent enzyme [Bryobacteraceae bacterium]